jgi:hypothetical protein
MSTPKKDLVPAAPKSTLDGGSVKGLKISKRGSAAARQGSLAGCGRNWDNLCGARK